MEVVCGIIVYLLVGALFVSDLPVDWDKPKSVALGVFFGLFFPIFIIASILTIIVRQFKK